MLWDKSKQFPTISKREKRKLVVSYFCMEKRGMVGNCVDLSKSIFPLDIRVGFKIFP